jgi:two-component system nitrogen regulation response regulator NtrX
MPIREVEMARVLIVDDEMNIRKLLAGVLIDEGYETEAVASGEEALDRLHQPAPGIDAVLLDLALPGKDGLGVLEDIQKLDRIPVVLMMSGHGTIENAVKATKSGAFDFIQKPLSAPKLLISLENALRVRSLERERSELLQRLGDRNRMLGDSPPMQQLRHEIERAGSSQARILIQGENGTGKELVARAIHTISPRHQAPFQRLNCAAIPRDLIESELFGYEKGAFTGASGQKQGKFELANGGTLFLDEIGDMSLDTQAKLLRVLEENEMERVGGTETIALDARVVAATNKSLVEEIRQGRFREDLYFRLAVVTINVPPLRDRGPDITSLAQTFLQQSCDENGRRHKNLTDAALALLSQYHWPGNVRELRNMMERVVIMVDADAIDVDHLRPLLLQTSSDDVLPSGGTLREHLENFERSSIEKALAASRGNIAQAARALGLDRANLHRKLRRFGLVKGRPSAGDAG